MIVFALAATLCTLTVALVAARALRSLPTVRLQLTGLALLAVLLPLATVLFSGLVMFHMGADVRILAIAAASAAAAVGTALAIGSTILQRIDLLSRASSALAAGDLRARAPESGPRELAGLGRSFNEMAANLEDIFDARRELVAAVGHDLRTPIASINAMLEAIDDGLASPDEYLLSLREQGRRLAELVDDFFDLARIDAGALAHELQSVPLEPVVTSCLRSLQAQAAARNVRLEHHLLDESRARCAPLQVERVLLNVLTNALRHTPPDGTIAVFLDREDEEVRVTVEDTGAGLAPETVRRMFDRFWRADPSRSESGAGLGLAIARGLVEAQGGRMWAVSAPKGGARVSFTLPAAV